MANRRNDVTNDVNNDFAELNKINLNDKDTNRQNKQDDRQQKNENTQDNQNNKNISDKDAFKPQINNDPSHTKADLKEKEKNTYHQCPRCKEDIKHQSELEEHKKVCH
jgi:hypothetical protein